eukprot:RCo010870
MIRQKFACCSGHNAYEFVDPLDKAVSDSVAMAKLLSDNSFTVISANDAPRNALKRAIRQFHQALTPNCLAFFFFSGYAVQQDGVNYLVPKDADCRLGADVEDDCISLQWVLRGMTECAGCLAAVFIEGARGNPFQHKWSSSTVPLSKGLAAVKPPSGALIGFSAEPGSTISFEYTMESNSVFTQALLDCIAVPGVSLVDAMRDVHSQVLSATDDAQRVWVQARMAEAFYVNSAAVSSRDESQPEPEVAAPPPRVSSRGSRGIAVASSPAAGTSATVWALVQVPHLASWRSPFISCSGRPHAWGKVTFDEAAHPSMSMDSNVVVGLDPVLSSGRHVLTLHFRRPPEETQAAHSIELISASAVYSNEAKTLSFELPNVVECEATVEVDFPRDVMTVRTSDSAEATSLPISDLAV